jgi:cytochrome c biogenesis protein CcdA
VSVQTRIVLGTLCVFNAFILIVLGVGAAFVVNGAAAPIIAASFLGLAGLLLAVSRRLRKGTEWN